MTARSTDAPLATMPGQWHPWEQPRILIIRFSSLGDVLLTTTLLPVLARHRPELRVDYLTRPQYADLLHFHPLVERVICYDPAGDGVGLWRVRRAIHLMPYQAVLDLQANWRSLLLTLPPRPWPLARFQKHRLRRFLHVHTPLNLYGPPLALVGSVAERYGHTLRVLGIEARPTRLEVVLPAEQLDRAEKQWAALRREGFGLLMAPGARHFTKRWPPEYYSQLIGLLYQKLGKRSLLIGAPEEAALCGQIEAEAPEGSCRSLAGRLNLLQTAALIARCPVLVSNDSAAMHLAAAFQRPQLAFFGGTSRELGFSPLNPRATVLENPDLACRPCSHIGRKACPRGHFLCMKSLSPEQALDRLFPLLEKPENS
ncbi:MAG: glycosyltransferase family 9 protein [Calditrichaeota bacterium]|nr:MAG: glycosyltransferase family 9 protein [Calditrichota bacterium]